MKLPRVIYVTGIDGSGKTTVVEWLAEQLRGRGYQVDVLWLRFNHVLSKPLLAFCRLVGLTRYEMTNGIRVGYHEFHRSKLVAWLFVAFQYLDAVMVRWLRIGPRLRKANRIVVLDRYVFDILIDLMIDTRIDDLHSGPVGKAFLKLLPAGTVVLPLLRDRDSLLAARPESVVDRNFEARQRLYEELPTVYGLRPLRNDRGLEELLAQVAAHVGLDHES